MVADPIVAAKRGPAAAFLAGRAVNVAWMLVLAIALFAGVAV